MPALVAIRPADGASMARLDYSRSNLVGSAKLKASLRPGARFGRIDVGSGSKGAQAFHELFHRYLAHHTAARMFFAGMGRDNKKRGWSGHLEPV